MKHPLADIAVFIIYFLISTAFGRKILTAIGVTVGSSAERFVFAAALGMGVTAYLVLGVGLLGFLTAPILGAVLCFIGLASVCEFIALLIEFVHGVKRIKSFISPVGLWISAAIILIILPVFVATLAPPAELDWDGLSYHLAIPKIYLANHQILHVPFISHSNFPFLIEMLYTLGLAFGCVAAAKLFHFVCFVLSAIAVYCIGMSHLNSSAGRLGALLFVSVPVIIWEASCAYADLATALFLSLAVYAVLNWQPEKQGSWLVVCGLMCGFALSTKVLAAVPVTVLCIWVIASSGWRGKGLKSALCVGLLALIVGSPWYIKSWLYTGNPVYPFLYSIFGGKYWSESAATAYQGAQNVFGMGHGWWQILMVPWNLTMNGRYFFDAPEKTKLFSLLGPAFLAFIPLGLISRQRNRAFAAICFVCVVYGITWFFLMQQVRYLIGIAPLLALAAGWGLDSVNREWRVAKWFANGLTVLLVCFSLHTAYSLSVQPAQVVFGMKSPDDYLSANLDVYDAESYINEYTPKNSKIVLFDEVRGFYLNRPYIWGNPGHHELVPWATFKTGRDMVRFFQSRGYTHALVNQRYASYSGNDLLHGKLLPQAIYSGEMQPIYESNGSEVYELVSR